MRPNSGTYRGDHKQDIIGLDELDDIPPGEHSRHDQQYHQDEQCIARHAYVSSMVVVRYREERWERARHGSILSRSETRRDERKIA